MNTKNSIKDVYAKKFLFFSGEKKFFEVNNGYITSYKYNVEIVKQFMASEPSESYVIDVRVDSGIEARLVFADEGIYFITGRPEKAITERLFKYEDRGYDKVEDLLREYAIL